MEANTRRRLRRRGRSKAVFCRQVSRIIVFEERCRHDLVGRAHQIAIDAKMTAFLQSLGVDFDNIEGCREQGCFFTRSGVFIEYMLSIIQRLDVPIDLRLNCKVRST